MFLMSSLIEVSIARDILRGKRGTNTVWTESQRMMLGFVHDTFKKTRIEQN